MCPRRKVTSFVTRRWNDYLVSIGGCTWPIESNRQLSNDICQFQREFLWGDKHRSISIDILMQGSQGDRKGKSWFQSDSSYGTWLPKHISLCLSICHFDKAKLSDRMLHIHNHISCGVSTEFEMVIDVIWMIKSEFSPMRCVLITMFIRYKRERRTATPFIINSITKTFIIFLHLRYFTNGSADDTNSEYCSLHQPTALPLHLGSALIPRNLFRIPNPIASCLIPTRICTWNIQLKWVRWSLIW